jgi:diacylglycerol O-acyltransferase / wax synthase
VTKLHHSLTDGIGGVQLAALVVDPGPDADSLDAPPAEPVGHSLSTVGLTARSIGDDVVEFSSAAGRVARSIPGLLLHAAIHPLDTAQQSAAAAASIARFVAPIAAASSTLLGERHIRRQLVTIDIPLSELHSAAVAGGGHLNDAYLAALTGAMHRYHLRRGAELRELRVTVPVSVRTGADTLGGNRITLIRITLPAELAEPAERIGQIAAVMRGWRHEPALAHTQPIAFGLNLLPRAYLGGVFKRVELLASDVPGLPVPVWLAGARITGYYAFGPTIGAGLNATLMSYAGTCNIGVNIDIDAVDDPTEMLECIHQGIDEVLALAHPAPDEAGSAKPTTT